MRALLILALFPVVFSNPSAEEGHRAAETTALRAKIERMMGPKRGPKRGTKRVTAKIERKMHPKQVKVVNSDVTLYLSREKLNHDEAEAKCRTYDGHLASPTSVRQLDLLEADRETRYLSGVFDRDANQWKWGTGELIRPTARDWSEDNPIDWTCLLYFLSYMGAESNELYPIMCWLRVHYACEIPGLKVGNSEFAAIQVKTTYVVVEKSHINYTDAAAECASMKTGAHLATPTNFREMELIYSSMKNSTDEYWLGAKRAHLGERGMWITGEPIVANLRGWYGDDGGNCLATCGGLLDWFTCDGIPSAQSGVGSHQYSIEGYVCQLD